ncbi:MAG: bifunctional diaminohydroxyphosphoribosylaminopyrimidine deaminase/5-amino-6-(5-phosphoribosylamino)uracil reductase RibD [Phycisphaerales bacterium]
MPPARPLPPSPSHAACRRWLDLATRHALRAEGLVEPNPLVGCVLVPASIDTEVASDADASDLTARGLVGVGHHRVFGGAHAEVEALASCARLGIDPRGGTAFVTLEPCDRWGKTGPCTEALIKAGIARVVFARQDPAQDGEATLRREGLDVIVTDASPHALDLSEPFVHRLETGLPWVVGKWAQTLDGKSATSAGESQWLTGPRTRRAAHRLRGRVDAILTGIGTVLADDPLLTARNVTPRRRALRVVIDPRLDLPDDARLTQSANESPVLVITTDSAPASREKRLAELGVRILRLPAPDGTIDLSEALGLLAREHGVATMMTECGPRLMGRLLDAGLIHELRAYVAPLVMGDHAALPAFVGGPVGTLDHVERWRLAGTRSIGDDVELRYRRHEP